MEARDSFDVAYLVLIIGLNGFAFFIIAICYSQIYFSLGKETRQAARYASRGEMTVAKKMALLVENKTHNLLILLLNRTEIIIPLDIISGIHKFCMLGTNRFLWANRIGWRSINKCG